MKKLPRARPTQKQIAEKLGLSAATISLALRDNPVVAKATRELVQQAMRDTGYVRNLAAASLRTGRSNIVGVSFPDIAHGYFGEMLIAIERTFAASGTVVLINNHGEDVASLERFTGTLATYGADALIVAPPPNTPLSLMEAVRKHGMQTLYFRRFLPDDNSADYVGIDHTKAVDMAVDHLRDSGYENLFLVGGEPGTSVSDERVEGFRNALKRAGIGWQDDRWLNCPANGEDARDALKALLQRFSTPVGLVCYNDLVGAGAISATRSAGLEVGRDVGIVAISGTRGSVMTSPSLTMVAVEAADIGETAANTLLERLADTAPEAKCIVLEPKLVIGESCRSRQDA